MTKLIDIFFSSHFNTWISIMLIITSLIISIRLLKEGNTTLAILFLILFFLLNILK